jgi:oxygen-independent coproporphyrinogen-3 oxidase
MNEALTMDPLVKKYAGAKVPRYTSYPTVPDFQKGFAGATYRRWLEALDPMEAVSLYLHVPFCRKMCWYCGCNMKLANRYEPISDYVETLIKEIELVASFLPERLPVSHLHWGGGTPTALSPDDLERVMGVVQERFAITDEAELAIESDPRTLTAEMANRIGRLGFNRASFGVQEFDPKVQTAINRIQPPDMVERSVEWLREAGISGINFDLIYGLPHQTIESITTTIDICRRMQPGRVALFGYAHVPWMAKNQRMIPEDALPDADARYAQAKAAAERLVENGYLDIGLDHFALPDDSLAIAAGNGTLRRNFQGYTTDQAATLLGLGATSIGKTPSGYVQNIAETRAWSRAVEEGNLPVAKGHALSDDDRIRGYVIEQIMCQGAVDLAGLTREFALPADWCRNEISRLNELAEDGLVMLDDGLLHLTDRGRPLARVVASAFDVYRQHGSSRHSVAV